jgi:predicted outer membrane protein
MKYASTTFGALLLSLAAIPAVAALSSEDRTFVTKAAAGGQAEVAFGQLAKENASSPAVIVPALIVLNPEARKGPICACECWV